jgi:predicted nucleotide-binding protein
VGLDVAFVFRETLEEANNLAQEKARNLVFTKASQTPEPCLLNSQVDLQGVATVARPEIFFASSSESLQLLQILALQITADDWAFPRIWNFDTHSLGTSFLTALLEVKSDFAVILHTPDDKTESRGKVFSSPRDNLVFELGLFIGKLGPSKTVLIAPKDPSFKLLTDYSGITHVQYDSSHGSPEQFLLNKALSIKYHLMREWNKPRK